ncbi:MULTISPECIES: acyl-CoA dehydrogenase family protein [unclassified Pseudonocardia]|uniref:acyl-CoA dehydrogenase family protein n=1 Tax=unclassified Pseudonocardia TaxID=2619320 RepID=UPI000960C630|nr:MULTISPECIES: acyl-CoA dehydrogenase family protein [unclassified Pseudonocardia]MBN9102719.1 acyl-CoA dehydrogenase family protein [Pseudonocardia sp.]OJY47819.1 MAG: acyl-CoA dehydrogenase [Pseudonocardia sp. 73-21]
MDYGFSAEQEAFRQELRAFSTKELAPHYRSDDLAATLRPDLAPTLARMGLTGLRVPERFGGQEADAVTTGMAAEEVSRADFNACYLLLNSALVSEILLAGAGEEQLARWLPPIASGASVPALCLTEPAQGSDAANLQLRAEPDGAGWRLFGEKTSISLGMHADVGAVFARTGGPGARGVSAFMVDLGDEHLARTPLDDHGSRAIGRASLYFDGLPVGRDQLIGTEGEGFISVMKGFDYSRAVIGLMCLGIASAALDDAFAYAREREAFGKPIGTFQGLAFPLVECATHLRAARLLCYEALALKDAGRDPAVPANMAKWWAPKLAADIVHQSLLTFGHAGWSTDNPQGQRLRDVIGLEIGDGTAQIAKLVVARHLLGRAFAP